MSNHKEAGHTSLFRYSPNNPALLDKVPMSPLRKLLLKSNTYGKKLHKE